MNPVAPYQLTRRQIARLALSVLVIYYPIVLYANLPELNDPFLLRLAPYLLSELMLTGLFYFVWISFIEWLLPRLATWFGEELLVEFNLPAQVLVLLIAIVAAILLNGLLHLAWEQTAPPPPVGGQISQADRRAWDHFERSNRGLTIVIMLSIFYVSANRRGNRRLKDIQVQAASLEKEAVLAQFTALKSQVSPHFLFNSLSILTSLVHVSPDLSEQFINQLSKAYRYILEQKDNDRVGLRTELAFIRSYIFLLNIRFEDSFTVAINLPAALETQYAIAPLTLQLLLENAVKHNRMTRTEPLRVAITAEGDYLVVQNPMQPREQNEHSTGLGLQNILNRYRLLTSQPVWVGEREGAFVVKIPLLPCLMSE